MLITTSTLGSATGVGIAAFQSLVGLTAFSSQSNESMATPYGKFALLNDNNEKGPRVSGKTNMLLIYTPALAVNANMLLKAAEGWGWGEGTSTIASSIVGAGPSILVLFALTAHFLKRVLETLFLHRYSTTVNPSVGTFIGGYYAFVSWLILHFQAMVPATSVNPSAVAAGVALFAIGEIGNFWHHCLLAALRTPGDSGYKTPRGGLFRFVTCPHYLFELVAWLGIALMTQEVHSFLVFASMSSYLGGRSVSQNRWARSNIDAYPGDRKNIIPLIF